jgi:hypothetical protein
MNRSKSLEVQPKRLKKFHIASRDCDVWGTATGASIPGGKYFEFQICSRVHTYGRWKAVLVTGPTNRLLNELYSNSNLKVEIFRAHQLSYCYLFSALTACAGRALQSGIGNFKCVPE